MHGQVRRRGLLTSGGAWVSAATADAPTSAAPAGAMRLLIARGWPFVVLAAVAALLFFSLFLGLPFRSHESPWLYMRPARYLTEISSGHFPPRLFPSGPGAVGYAFPLLYPPLAQWIAAGLVWATGSAVWGVHLAFFASVLLSGLAFYVCARDLGASPTLATAGAITYIALPYRMIDVYVRGALAESWAFVWFPLVVAGIARSVRRRTVSVVFPLAVAGMLLTHAVVGLHFLTAAAVIWLAVFGRDIRLTAAMAGAGVLGLGLAAWHVLPSQHLVPGLWVSDAEFAWATSAHVVQHAVLPAQLVYGDSAHWRGYSPGGMGFTLGVAQWLTPVAGAFWWFATQRDRRHSAIAHFAVACDVCWAVCLLFVVAPGPFLHVLPPAYGYVQFPWRILGLAAFFGPLASTLFLAQVRLKRREYLFLGLAVLLAFARQSYELKPVVVPSVATLQRENPDPEFAISGWMMPRAVAPESAVIAIRNSPALLRGSGRFAVRGASDGELTVEGLAQAPTELQVPRLAYPLYRVEGSPARLRQNGGLVLLELPRGPVHLRLVRRAPPEWRLAMSLTALSIAVVIALAVWNGRNRRVAAPPGELARA